MGRPVVPLVIDAVPHRLFGNCAVPLLGSPVAAFVVDPKILKAAQSASIRNFLELLGHKMPAHEVRRRSKVEGAAVDVIPRIEVCPVSGIAAAHGVPLETLRKLHDVLEQIRVSYPSQPSVR